MSTNSLIAMVDDGMIKAIYCHWDGYPAYNGNILLNHYKDKKKIRRLISLGSISSLNKKIGRKNNFIDPKEGIVIAYHRDRGDNLNIEKFNNKKELFSYIKNNSYYEHVYLYDRGWKYIDSKCELIDLKKFFV